MTDNIGRNALLGAIARLDKNPDLTDRNTLTLAWRNHDNYQDYENSGCTDEEEYDCPPVRVAC